MRAAALLAALLAALPAAAEEARPPPAAPAPPAAPRRVVSMNLCTDQLALMLAAPGQLVSVTALAADPRGSVMAEAARGLALNHGLAEEIHLLRPDLVLAGAWSTRTTTDMLRRLGIPVAVFEPETSLEEVGGSLRRMGEVLGREEEAEKMAAEYEARLDRLRAAAVEVRPRAALYGANGWTSGDLSLAGQILELAGFENVADELGLAAGGVLPLELLALADPDAVVTSRPAPGGSRAEEVAAHPVVEALRAGRGAVEDRDWVCGTPHVLRAADRLAVLRGEAG